MSLGEGISPLLGPLADGAGHPRPNGPTAIRYTMGVGQQRKPGHPSTTTCITVNIPTSNQIGAAMERIARITAILIAATMAAYATTQSGIRAIATLATRLTRRPLRTLIDLVPSVTPTPAPAPNLLTLLGAEILTDEQMMIEIARYDADTRKRPATKKPTARRKPAAATKVAVGV